MKTKAALIPYLLLAAAMAGGLLWHESESVPRLGHVISSGNIQVGGPYRLTDQEGKTRPSSDFKGRYQLIYFGYTNCPDVCPTTLDVIAEALEKMGPEGKRITPIFITVDPGHDTPAILKPYMKAFGPNFIGLTGSKAQIDAVKKTYRVYAKKTPLEGGKYGFDHSNVLYLMGPDGKIVTYFDELISPDDLAKELKAKI
jgi:cytochrome oxidase Cu insertion factor (SCO1/SenC/PrrC family)